MIKIGILGCGKIAQVRHIPEYADNPDCELVGFFNPTKSRAEDMAAKYGGKAYDTAEELLADPEIAKGYLPSLGLGLVFAVIGALRYVINAFKQAGAQTAPEAASQPDLCAVNSQPAQFTENPQSDPFALQQDGGVTGGENGEKNG